MLTPYMAEKTEKHMVLSFVSETYFSTFFDILTDKIHFRRLMDSVILMIYRHSIEGYILCNKKHFFLGCSYCYFKQKCIRLQSPLLMTFCPCDPCIKMFAVVDLVLNCVPCVWGDSVTVLQ